MYNFPQILSALHFWDPASSTFHTPYGMLSITLFEVTVITGLKPTGQVISPSISPQSSVDLDFSNPSYINFIQNNMGSGPEISEQEHTAFLLLWLSYSVFYSKSLSVGKSMLPLARLLHEGIDVSLSKLLLASLYESLGDLYMSLKDHNICPSNIGSPFWLLQLWLNAIYYLSFKEVNIALPSKTPYGRKLVHLSVYMSSAEQKLAFRTYFQWFLTLKTYNPYLSPFSTRN